MATKIPIKKKQPPPPPPPEKERYEEEEQYKEPIPDKVSSPEIPIKREGDPYDKEPVSGKVPVEPEPPPEPPPRGGGGGGAATSGGGGGGGGGTGVPIGEGGYHAHPDPHADLDALIKKNVMDRISGRSSAFPPELMEMMKQKLFEETQGQTRRARESIYADAARRGIFRSGVTSGGVAAVETAGIKAYSAGVRDILLQKALADYQDRKEAIRDAMQWINNVRQYELGKEQNAIAREQIKATLEAASIAASAQMYAADQALRGALAAASASRSAANRAYRSSLYIDSYGNYVLGPNGEPITIAQAAAMEELYV